MIDIRTDEVITLREAAKMLPKRRRGRKPHVATLHRWASRGLRGIKLETIQIGGTLCTSPKAMQEFFERLTKGELDDPESRPTQGRERHIAEAEDLLDDAGI